MDAPLSAAIVAITASAWLYLTGHALFFWVKFLRYRPPSPETLDSPVSVVVAAKNEAEALEAHLPLWLGQDYPEFEVVVINDRSTDRTAEVLDRYADYPRLRIVRIDPQEWKSFIGNKKYALTMGIKAARHPYLLFTDADCRPASDRWIRLMTAPFTEGKEIVLGYGKYARRPGWLNLLVRYETLLTALNYMGFALRGKPYMGVGRNLAYTRELFFRNDGFKNHFELLSGDDDLFVNENATAENTAVCIRPQAHTVSDPPTTWGSWIRQKRRHYSTARHYRTAHKMLLFLEAATRTLFWTGSFVMLALPPWRPWAAGMIFAKLITGAAVFGKAGKKLDDPLPLWAVPLLEIQLWALQLWIFFTGPFKKRITWN